MSDQPADQKAINSKMIEDFRETREREGVPMNGRPMLLLTTTGIKSGKKRTTPMMKVVDGAHLLVIASNIGAPKDPNWYTNLVAEPFVMVESGAETFNATARPADGDEYDKLWAEVTRQYPFS
ncbi:MAG: nitroreductase/quinone reductase family protein [Chloroflexia bacterium]